MNKDSKNCKSLRKQKTNKPMSPPSDGSRMTKEERRDKALQLLADSDVALTPYVLFRNLKMRGATFERRSVSNYLEELMELEYVERVEQPGHDLYRITDRGREYLAGELDDT